MITLFSSNLLNIQVANFKDVNMRILQILAGIVCLALTMGPTTQSTGEDYEMTNSTLWGDPIDGCRLRIVNVKREVAAGEALDLELEIENSGPDDVSFFRDGYEHRGDYLDVKGSEPTSSGLTKTRYATERVLSRSSTGLEVIKRTQKTKLFIRLNQLVDMSVSGTYILRLELRLQINNKFFAISSRAFTVTISAPDVGENK